MHFYLYINLMLNKQMLMYYLSWPIILQFYDLVSLMLFSFHPLIEVSTIYFIKHCLYMGGTVDLDALLLLLFFLNFNV